MEISKKIISTSGGSGPLQMVSELDTGRCVNTYCFSKGIDTRWCANKNTEPQMEWIWWDRWGPTSIGERNECHEDAGPRRTKHPL